MYRQYENPRGLEKQLLEAKRRYEEEKLRQETERYIDDEVLVALYWDIEDLEERINFAWQDEEADCMTV